VARLTSFAHARSLQLAGRAPGAHQRADGGRGGAASDHDGRPVQPWPAGTLAHLRAHGSWLGGCGWPTALITPLQLTDMLQWGVKETSKLETEFVAVERLLEYINEAFEVSGGVREGRRERAYTAARLGERVRPQSGGLAQRGPDPVRRLLGALPARLALRPAPPQPHDRRRGEGRAVGRLDGCGGWRVPAARSRSASWAALARASRR